MKVIGSKVPSNAFMLVPRPKKPGYIQIRLFENVQPYESVDDKNEIFKGFQYDMYVLEMPESDGLEAKVLENFDTYLAQAKAIETGLTNMEDFIGCAEGSDIVEIVRAAKLKEISKECNAIIEGGFDLELATGAAHFNLDKNDQANIDSLFDIVRLGGTEYPYQSDDGVCRIYSVAEIAQIYLTAQGHITSQLTYHNILKKYVQALGSIEEIAAVQYGMELPEPFKADLESKLAVAQEQRNAIMRKLGG